MPPWCSWAIGHPRNRMKGESEVCWGEGIDETCSSFWLQKSSLRSNTMFPFLKNSVQKKPHFHIFLHEFEILGQDNIMQLPWKKTNRERSNSACWFPTDMCGQDLPPECLGSIVPLSWTESLQYFVSFYLRVYPWSIVHYVAVSPFSWYRHTSSWSPTVPTLFFFSWQQATAILSNVSFSHLANSFRTL